MHPTEALQSSQVECSRTAKVAVRLALEDGRRMMSFVALLHTCPTVRLDGRKTAKYALHNSIVRCQPCRWAVTLVVRNCT